jgi:hypothetical protein
LDLAFTIKPVSQAVQSDFLFDGLNTAGDVYLQQYAVLSNIKWLDGLDTSTAPNRYIV